MCMQIIALDSQKIFHQSEEDIKDLFGSLGYYVLLCLDEVS